MSSALEQKVQRRLTSAFIDADPLQVTVSRRERVPNGSGGFRLGPPSSLSPQKGRLIPSQYQLPDRETANGTIASPGSVLVMEWNADIKRFDEFTDANGFVFQVVWVYEKRDYETKCELVTLRGAV